MSIKLNTVRSSKIKEGALSEGHLYKDLKFDIQLSAPGSDALHAKNDDKELLAVYDTDAVLGSLKNILTTSPGEKLLNPFFGLDFRRFLFENITDSVAFFIGQSILNGLVVQEPRVEVDQIDIVGIPDENQYDITMSISIPTLKVFDLTLRGVLNNNGFTFV
jgi:phage baseplate assembly protein W